MAICGVYIISVHKIFSELTENERPLGDFVNKWASINSSRLQRKPKKTLKYSNYCNYKKTPLSNYEKWCEMEKVTIEKEKKKIKRSECVWVWGGRRSRNDKGEERVRGIAERKFQRKIMILAVLFANSVGNVLIERFAPRSISKLWFFPPFSSSNSLLGSSFFSSHSFDRKLVGLF